MSVDEIELVHAQQGRPDGLDLNVGEGFADATMPPCSEGNVTEFILARRSLPILESVVEKTKTKENHQVDMSRF